MKMLRKNSGIIIIGNEIISGKTLDKNSNFLCKKLEEIGIDVDEVCIIKDIEKKIVEKVRLYSSKYDYVFTTGGIGPTHDDITSSSVAKAMKYKLVLNQEAKNLLEKHYSDELLTKARLKMAYLPEKASIIYNPVSIAPGFQIKNIYVFPGVPKILQIMFNEFLKKITNGKKVYQKNITTTLSEGIIGDYIESIQKMFLDLEIGSYPYFKKKTFGVSLIIKGDKKNRVENAVKKIFNYLELIGGKPKLF